MCPLRKQFDGNVIELESRDVTFLEAEFLSRDEIDRNHPFYEMKDPKT